MQREKDMVQSEPKRLMEAVRQSDQYLKRFREIRSNLSKHLAGGTYLGRDNYIKGYRLEEPVNHLHLVASSLIPSLSIDQFVVDVSATSEDQRVIGSMFASRINTSLAEIDAATAVNRAMHDAMLMWGIVKTATGDDGLFCDWVSPNDYVIDQRARSHDPGEYAFEGHRFKMGFEEAMDSDLFSPTARKIIESLGPAAYGNNDDTERERREQSVAHEFRPQIEMIELYLPHKKQMVWLPSNFNTSSGLEIEYVHQYAWEGPEEGPFDLLWFMKGNEDLVPYAPLATIFDLSRLLSSIQERIGKDADDRRDIIVADSPNAGDVDSLHRAKHGDILRSPGIKADVLTVGGISQDAFAASAYFAEQLNKLAGNPELMGGLSSQSETLGQDQMLMGAAGARVTKMRTDMMRMANSIAKKVAWYQWHDNDGGTVPVSLGVGHPVPVQWPGKDRRGAFDDYKLSISASAIGLKSRDEKLAALGQWINTFVLPFMEVAAANGSKPNIDLLTNLAGQWLGLDAIEDLWLEGNPVMVDAPGPAPQGPESGMMLPRGRVGDSQQAMGVAAVEGMSNA
jgi:hypothetical protein